MPTCICCGKINEGTEEDDFKYIQIRGTDENNHYVGSLESFKWGCIVGGIVNHESPRNFLGVCKHCRKNFMVKSELRITLEKIEKRLEELEKHTHNVSVNLS